MTKLPMQTSLRMTANTAHSAQFISFGGVIRPLLTSLRMILDPTKKQVFLKKVKTSWFEPYKTYIENYELECGAKIGKAFWVRHFFGIREPNTAHNPFTQNRFLITAHFLYLSGSMGSFVATILTNNQIPCWFPKNHPDLCQQNK